MNANLKPVVGLLLFVALLMFGAIKTSVPTENSALNQGEIHGAEKRVLGPVATVVEAETDLPFLARVDTGAKTSSLHAAEKQIVNGTENMEENIGKTVRFRIQNRHGSTDWLERTIAEVRRIRTSEGEEARYLVPMTFTCSGVEREVLVSLNDRSRMTYTMLLGRNFLAGQFVVDVSGADDEASDMLVSGL